MKAFDVKFVEILWFKSSSVDYISVVIELTESGGDWLLGCPTYREELLSTPNWKPSQLMKTGRAGIPIRRSTGFRNFSINHDSTVELKVGS